MKLVVSDFLNSAVSLDKHKLFSVAAVLFVLAGSSLFGTSWAQGVQTSGGVDVDGTWYVGEGLKKGDYFEYSVCQLDLKDCAPMTMKFWIRGDIKKGSETLWDTVMVVEDGNKISKGTMALGKASPEPVSQSDNLFQYSRAFKSSLSWLSAFATADSDDYVHGPKAFKSRAWGKIGAIGGAQLIPLRSEKVAVPGGVFDSVVVGWYSGNNNEIWVVDGFPFPVKALTYAWVTSGIAPVQFQFQLLDYEEDVKTDPFTNVESTPDQSALLGCPAEYNNYVSGSQSTNTFSATLDYAYAPERPMEGCAIDWKLNFKDKYNQNEFLSEVHFDIWVVDDDGQKIRSYASEIGRTDIFNGFGLAHIVLPVKEKAGKNHYAVFLYGVGPQEQEPKSDLAGYVLIDVNVAPNKNLQNKPVVTKDIPSWVKNNAKWWADGTIGDSDFVSGMQYLIKGGIIKLV